MASFCGVKFTDRSDAAVAKCQVCKVEMWNACCLRSQVISGCREYAIERPPKAGVGVKKKVDFGIVVVEEVWSPGTEDTCKIVSAYHYE